MGFFIGLAGAFIAGSVAEKKGRNFWTWAIYGFLLAPIAVIHSFFIKDRSGKQCLACKEWINKEATICKNCKTLQEGRDNSMYNINN